MKLKKIFAVMCMIGIAANVCTMHSFAETVSESAVAASADDNTRTEWLIQSYHLSISAGTKCIYVTASTVGTGVMAEIGFTDIEVQRSSNGYSGWTPYLLPNDATDEDTISFDWYNHCINVVHGYYYRVALNHYARESNWPWSDEQSVPDTSNAVYV
jgi:hypothetical protein